MALIAAALAADGQSRLVAARDGRARLRPAGRAAAGARREGREDGVRRDRLTSRDARGAGGIGEAVGCRARPAVGGGCRRPAPGCRRRRVGAAARAASAAAAARAAAAAPSAAPIESRPTRNGRRSASVRSSTRMMCGVSVRMMSVCVGRSSACARTAGRCSGMSLSPGMPSSDLPLVVADQAGQHVRLAVAQPDDRVDLAVAERRQAAEARARNARAPPSSASSVTSSSWCVRGVMSMLTPMFS